jgi:hypothetical protein
MPVEEWGNMIIMTLAYAQRADVDYLSQHYSKSIRETPLQDTILIKTMFFSKPANWINTTPANGPLTDFYAADSGEYVILIVMSCQDSMLTNF